MKPSLTLKRLGKGFSRKWPVRLTALSAEARISGHVGQSVPQGLKPSSGSLFGTAEAVPFVKSLFPICLKPSPNPIPCGTAKAEAVPFVSPAPAVGPAERAIRQKQFSRSCGSTAAGFTRRILFTLFSD